MASISHRRKLVADALRRLLPESYVVAASPDHPLLIESPDLLIGGEGNMVAIFMPRAIERKSRNRLSVRFILSRLALPPHTRNILVVERSVDDLIANKFKDDFAEIVDEQGIEDIARVSQTRESIGRHRDIPRDIANFARHRFADVYDVTHLLKKIEERKQSREARDTERRTPRPERRRARRSDFFQAAPGVISTRFEAGIVRTPGVYELVRHTTSSLFGLDDGVPYPTGKDEYGLALVQELPEFRSDPEKLVRAAAFAGWAFADEEYFAKADQIAEILSTRRERRRPI